MPTIHPTALVDPHAELADDVCVGPLAIIEAGVTIGRGTVVEAGAQLLTGTSIGEDCRIGRAAIIGGAPQSLSFDTRIPSGVKLGSRNRLREHVTIHRSLYEGKQTTVGNDNFLMVGAHVGHDVELGNQTVLANAVLLAGHVKVGSRVFLGGGCVIHQFIRVGDLAMVQGNGSFSKDIPPYLVAVRTNLVMGLNVVGLRRGGFSVAARREIKEAFDLLYRDGKNFSQAVAAAKARTWGPDAAKLIDFLETRGDKGVCPLTDSE